MDTQLYNTLFLAVVSFLPSAIIALGVFFFVKTKELKKKLIGFFLAFGIIMGVYTAFSTGGPVMTVDAPYVPEPEGNKELIPSDDFIPETRMDDYRDSFKDYEQEQDKRIQDSK